MHNRILTFGLHLALWAISFLLLYKLFTIDYNTGFGDVVYTGLFHIPLIMVVYLHIYAIKSLFEPKKYWVYFSTTLALLLFGTCLYFTIFKFLVPSFKVYYFIAYYTPREIAQFIAAYLVISFLLYLSFSWFRLKNKELQLERENHQVKLKNLKSQISPHFLFNSLNNIYGATSKEDKTTRSYLLHLSDSLRYLIYDTDVDFVPLHAEVEYLSNYVALEKLRFEDSKNIGLNIEGDIEKFVIAPLIFLPLVENCFVHCNRADPFIDISLSIKDHHLKFHSQNNLSLHHSRQGGVGLNNVKKRLELIYGNGHESTHEVADNIFKLYLSINLEHRPDEKP